MSDTIVSWRSKLDVRKAAVESGHVAECPIAAVVNGISGKWDLFLLTALAERRHRFGQLRRLFPDISQRMMTQTLLDLQRDGYVCREVLPTQPPSVEYSLTPLGTSLFGQVDNLLQWASQNQHAVHEARAAFETHHGR
jgi:DNA-binding HxlR family transcriptional regulator